MEDSMTSAVSGSCTTISLPSFAKFEALPPEGTLIDLAFTCSGKRQAKRL